MKTKQAQPGLHGQDRNPMSTPRSSRRFGQLIAICLSLAYSALICQAASATNIVFPGKSWEQREPAQVGLDAQQVGRVRHQCQRRRLRDQRRLPGQELGGTHDPQMVGLSVQAGAQHAAAAGRAGAEAAERGRAGEERWLGAVEQGFHDDFSAPGEHGERLCLRRAAGSGLGLQRFCASSSTRNRWRKCSTRSLDEAFQQRMAALQFEDGEFFGARGGLERGRPAPATSPGSDGCG